MPQSSVYAPENWLISTFRALRQYVETAFDNAVIGPGPGFVPLGLDKVYDIIDSFPDAGEINKRMPLSKTLIHFEIDDIENPTFGFGDNHFRYNYDAVQHYIRPQEARHHRIDFDWGIWTSDRAGGVTARLTAYQILDFLFHGTIAQKNLDAAVDGGDGRIEIISFSRGTFLVETINDIPVYRVADIGLTLRVFSRTPIPPVGAATPTIEEILIESRLRSTEGTTISG